MYNYNDVRKNENKGFSLVELIVVIAIMAVMTSVLAPALLQYVERSRAQKDDSAMGEVTNAIMLALSDQDIYDEVLFYACTNNNSCYGCNPILWTGNKKAQALWPGFSAAPHSSAALTIVTAHYKKGVPFIWEEKRSLSIKPMFRSMPLSGSLAACLMIYGPHMQTRKCKKNLHAGKHSGPN